MSSFYVSDVTQSELHLNLEESKHCVRVLRLGKNDEVILVDGRGNRFTAIIKEPDPHRCLLEIQSVEKEFGKRMHHLHLAVAPPKSSERFEWFLEKSTEIGCDEITPIICKRSERFIIKTERALKIMVSAMKQSGRAYLPLLNPVVNLTAFLPTADDPARIICHCGSNDLPLLGEVISKGSSALVLIGPEGDFTPDEIDLARRYRYREARLGSFVYRTETAGILACSIFNLVHGY